MAREGPAVQGVEVVYSACCAIGSAKKAVGEIQELVSLRHGNPRVKEQVASKNKTRHRCSNI